MKITPSLNSVLTELIYKLDWDSGRIVAFFNSHGGEHEPTTMLSSKRRFMQSAWPELPDASIEQAVLEIYETFLDNPEKISAELNKLNRVLRQQNVSLSLVDGCLSWSPSIQSTLTSLRNFSDEFSHNNLKAHLDSIEWAIEKNPTQAVGSAKDLIESVTKELIRRLEPGFEIPSKSNPNSLVKTALQKLQLDPSKIDDEGSRTKEAIKGMLNQLSAIASNLDKIRAEGGSGHGQNAERPLLMPRHAKLAVSASSAICTYLIDVFIERQARG